MGTYHASMSYKSLLFCPDERTARLVTQVLSELEFTVEPVQDAYSAVKKLNGEHFDALVVDCQSEQDGSLLFKTARNSTHNHSTLSVAVVEGQAGVAKAFRIGANLVLTKPINIEQSKGTLRVARGLLRKTEVKAAAATSQAPASILQKVPSFESAPAGVNMPADPVKANASPVLSAHASFSALESEPEPMPEPEAPEVAVLESLPQLDRSGAEQAPASFLRTEAEPIAASSSGQAAAVAPALDKAEPIAPKPTVMLPMVTNEPIVAETHFKEPEPAIEPPTFSSFETTQKSGGGAKFVKIAAILIAVAVAGYFGWQKLRPLQYLQQIRAARTTDTPPLAASADVHPTPPPASSTAPSVSKVEEPMSPAQEGEIAASPARNTPDEDSDSINVQELPMSRDAKPSTPPKSEPLIVKPDSGVKKNGTAQPAPPQVQVSSASTSASAIANLATIKPALPTLAPTSSVRVSQGVSQGLILKKVPPVYPPMALQLHKEGSIELLATISKQGVIANVKVISGDAMLSKPAADAVRQWKYRPYLLNGEPVEIQTQITIKFTAPR